MLEAWWQISRKPWDDAEFEDTFQLYYQGVFRLLFRLTGSAEEAADLAQEVFVRLYRQRFPPWREHNVRAWLYRVATNLASNARRGRQRQERREQAVLRVALPAPQDPAEAAARHEEQGHVRQALAKLPARQSQLLLLYYSGLSYRELAELLGVAEGSVGTLLARAKTAFETSYRAIQEAPGGGSDEM